MGQHELLQSERISNFCVSMFSKIFDRYERLDTNDFNVYSGAKL